MENINEICNIINIFITGFIKGLFLIWLIKQLF